MLQDLDARGGAGDDALRQQQLHGVGGQPRDRRPLAIGGALVLTAVVVGGGWFGWQYSQSHRAAQPQAPALAAAPVKAPQVAAASTPVAAAVAAPTSAPETAAPASAPAPAPAMAAAPTPVPADAPPAARESAPNRSWAQAPAAALAKSGAGPGSSAGRVATSDASATPETDAVEAAPRKPAVAARAERKPSRQAGAGNAAGEGTITHDISPQQMAENSYRRALVALQEGRVSAALADLDRALEIDPRNEAARQTNISLLLENKRNDDAIRQLRLALGIDPRQPGLAMVLARLQLERGGPALETLMTTLPYAGNSAEYQAFLAGVLQRQQRHTEAAQYYRAALTLAPQNGVWWMGLGISLQADMHLPEAREAYRRARASNGLSPELQAFIDRKIESLPH
ncbi:hypothetical protein D0T25_10650 [Duganella sp. BJB488]|nr:hypothetical protein D0T26_10690 [Duganella sp. BJB489]RFP23777.1 hypothetical protein D0T25_10650 [Duganella sp. BJB488]RFP38660.1 hypothetical protein D0T24_03495 [Duganella sp. BJB480]